MSEGLYIGQTPVFDAAGMGINLETLGCNHLTTDQIAYLGVPDIRPKSCSSTDAPFRKLELPPDDLFTFH